jgi:hypothetical protein
MRKSHADAMEAAAVIAKSPSPNRVPTSSALIDSAAASMTDLQGPLAAVPRQAISEALPQ